MLNFKPFFLTAIIITALCITNSAAAQHCHQTVTPIINITPSTKPITYITDKSSLELSSMVKELDVPENIPVYNPGEYVVKAGYYLARSSFNYTVKYDIKRNYSQKTFCIAYKEINYYSMRTPTIYIAKEYNSGQCGKDVLHHEKKTSYC